METGLDIEKYSGEFYDASVIMRNLGKDESLRGI